MRNDETMTTGEAARAISEALRPVSRQTVRRLILRGQLDAQWTRPPAHWTTDRHGKPMRGWRRVTLASVEAYVNSELARLAEIGNGDPEW